MACLKYTYKHTEDWKNSDNVYNGRLDDSVKEIEKELQIAYSKCNTTELACEVIEIYVDLLFPSMKRHQREVCKGCYYEIPLRSEHDVCFMMSKKAFLEEYLGKVTNPKNIVSS